MYYSAVRHECDAWDQPLGTPTAGPFHQALVSGPTVGLTTVTPDLENDMHDGTVTTATTGSPLGCTESWPAPASAPGHLAVLIVWDEGAGLEAIPLPTSCSS